MTLFVLQLFVPSMMIILYCAFLLPLYLFL